MKKIYYSIKEVSEMLGLAPHVLRYWETEFPDLKPRKNRAGNRTYREPDIALLREIKTLLHERKYTIDGARHELRLRRESGTTGDDTRVAEALRETKMTVRELLEMLWETPGDDDDETK